MNLFTKSGRYKFFRNIKKNMIWMFWYFKHYRSFRNIRNVLSFLEDNETVRNELPMLNVRSFIKGNKDWLCQIREMGIKEKEFFIESRPLIAFLKEEYVFLDVSVKNIPVQLVYFSSVKAKYMIFELFESIEDFADFLTDYMNPRASIEEWIGRTIFRNIFSEEDIAWMKNILEQDELRENKMVKKLKKKLDLEEKEETTDNVKQLSLWNEDEGL
ncbi:MAG: hypothetical protein ABIJ97_12800 [Bacteroidota bacterium]